MSNFLHLERHGLVLVVTLDRPKMNVLSREMQNDLADVARDVATDDSVRAVVFYGGERNFAAGADVKEMVHWDSDIAHRESPDLQSAFNAVASIPQPTIAAITGYALGGGLELAMSCDLRVAADNATLGQPEILLGIIPGAGGTQRLTRLVGVSRAKDLIMTGRFVTAAEAAVMGLVNEVVAPEQVFTRAVELASTLAAGPRLALAAAKRAIDRGIEVPLSQGLEIETAEFAGLFGSVDQQTGMTSFVENGPGKAVFE